MPPESPTPTELATFDEPLARAVVAVLRREGVRAWTAGADQGLAGEGMTVLVDPVDREDALQVLAARMEDVHDAAKSATGDKRAPVPPGRAGGPGGPGGTDEDAQPRLVLERFRRMGFLVFLLAPLLVVTLSARTMSVTWALIVLIGGMVALTAWHRRI